MTTKIEPGCMAIVLPYGMPVKVIGQDANPLLKHGGCLACGAVPASECHWRIEGYAYPYVCGTMLARVEKDQDITAELLREVREALEVMIDFIEEIRVQAREFDIAARHHEAKGHLNRASICKDHTQRLGAILAKYDEKSGGRM